MSDADSDIEPTAAVEDPPARSLAKEISVMYVVALLLILGCVLLAAVVPFVSQNLYALVAAVFVGLPYWWLGRRNENFERFALTWTNAARGVLWGLLFSVLTLGPFAVGYWWWEKHYLHHEFDFAADNFFKWPVEYEGRPSQWGKTRGVWVWSDGPQLHIGLRAGDDPVAVDVESNEAFRPQVIGPALLSPGQSASNRQAAQTRRRKRWTIRLDRAHTRAEVVLARKDGRAPPRQVSIRASTPDGGGSIAIHQGSSAATAGSTVDIERGLSWVVLWVLTQLVFIAFPEEFFYRGYLQTRIGQALAKWREARGRPAEGKRPWGFSAQNALTSLLFAAGHVLIPIGGVLVVTRASVFFPSLLFGWLRERTDTIAASVVYHAAANLMVLLAAPHFF